jgi:predicted DNA-binding transcriptional regulator AlpA
MKAKAKATTTSACPQCGHALQGILRLPQVCALSGLSASSVWKHASSGAFPRPVRLAVSVDSQSHATGWYAREVIDWINSRDRVASGRPSPRRRKTLKATPRPRPRHAGMAAEA